MLVYSRASQVSFRAAFTLEASLLYISQATAGPKELFRLLAGLAPTHSRGPPVSALSGGKHLSGGYPLSPLECRGDKQR